MRLSKREIVDQAFKDGKTVKKINEEFDISKSYIYQIKRKTKNLTTKLLDITDLVKKPSVNDFYLNGFNIKCNDDILTKIIKGLTND
jgi:predicted DNA-binding protein YlxM (UPF0122 family)